MRVLLLNEIEDDYCLTVKKIVDIEYSDVIYKTYEDEDNIEFASGLYMFTADGCGIYLEGIEKAECDLLCEKIWREGSLDLRKYGTYLYADTE